MAEQKNKTSQFLTIILRTTGLPIATSASCTSLRFQGHDGVAKFPLGINWIVKRWHIVMSDKLKPDNGTQVTAYTERKRKIHNIVVIMSSAILWTVQFSGSDKTILS